MNPFMPLIKHAIHANRAEKICIISLNKYSIFSEYAFYSVLLIEIVYISTLWLVFRAVYAVLWISLKNVNNTKVYCMEECK